MNEHDFSDTCIGAVLAVVMVLGVTLSIAPFFVDALWVKIVCAVVSAICYFLSGTYWSDMIESHKEKEKARREEEAEFTKRQEEIEHDRLKQQIIDICKEISDENKDNQ